MKVRLPAHADGGSIFDTNASITEFGPGDHGLISWSFDPSLAQGSITATAGVLQLVKLKVPDRVTITNLHLFVGVAGATLTANQCYASLYTSGGVLLANTAQQATNWASTGAKIMALSTPQTVNSGYIYVGFYSNGTTQPAFLRGITGANSSNNPGLATPNLRYATSGSGYTTAPPNPFGAQATSAVSYWAAVS